MTTKKKNKSPGSEEPSLGNDPELIAYHQDKLDAIKARIEYHLDQALEMGFNIIRAETGVKRVTPCFFPKPVIHWTAETPNVDAGGAICIVTQIDKPSVNEVVCFDWNVNTIFVSGFIHGYDMNEPEINQDMETFHSPRYIQGYEMGAKIAKEYVTNHSNE